VSRRILSGQPRGGYQRLVVEREDVTLAEIQLAAAVLAQLPAHPEAAETLRRLAGS
jgi:hypothetical protein